jgi:hypothetical protein
VTESVQLQSDFTTSDTLAETTTPSVQEQQGVDSLPRSSLNYMDEFRTKCGKVLGVRVIGGNEVGEHQYPWAVALGYDLDESARAFNCGGTLITDQVFVLYLLRKAGLICLVWA